MLNIINCIMEMQIKIAVKYHLTSINIAIIKKSKDYKYWGEHREKGIPVHCWWGYKFVQPLWKTV